MSSRSSSLRARSARTVQNTRVNLCELLEQRCLFAAGDLDTTFSGDGLVQSNINGSDDYCFDVAVQPDGKVIVVGRGGIARHNADGSIDTTFGTNGKTPTTSYLPRAVALQPDGRIVVVGEDDLDLVAARYLSTGKIDTSFSGDGRFSSGLLSFDFDVAVQNDGKIVIAGTNAGAITNHDFGVLRLNTNGTLDGTFGTPNGSARSGFRAIGFGGSDGADAVVIDYNGSPSTNPRYGTIVLGGSARIDDQPSQFAVARVKPNGDMDTSFSGDGKATVAFAAFANSTSVVIQPTGKIVLGGWAGEFGARDFALARVNTNGLLDTSFGSGGRTITNFSGNDEARDLITTFGGKLLAGGFSGYGNFTLACYDQEGRLDPGFKGNGKATTDFGATEEIAALARAPGNKFVAAGWYRSSNTTNVAIARYLDVGPTVSITASDATGSEAGPDTMSFRVLRSSALPFATRVYFSVGGTASAPGSTSSFFTDYTGISTSPTGRYVDIPAGATVSAAVVLTPKQDTQTEPTESVQIRPVASDAYTIGPANLVTLTIKDAAPAFADVRINFQPANAPLFNGYLADTGAVFGSRNGLNYGWDADNSATTRDRNNANSLDQRYDTLAHMQLNGVNRRWELAVPNGTYSVFIVAGDPNNTDSIYRINAENVLAVNATPTAGNPWVSGNVNVTVTDGRLTLTNAGGSSNNKICFIDITQTSAAGAAVNLVLKKSAVVALPLTGVDDILSNEEPLT